MLEVVVGAIGSEDFGFEAQGLVEASKVWVCRGFRV